MMTPEILLGPPGTGKTESLLNIVDEEIIKGTPPERIAFVSFTRRAAKEAVERACAKFGMEKSRFPLFRTLHSLCYRQLGLSAGDVLEGRSMREFADWLGLEITGRISWDEGSVFGSLPGDRILHLENLSRVRCVGLEAQYAEYADDLPWSDVLRVSKGLHEFKRRKHLVDYTDMLALWAHSQATVPLDVLLVDEAQDLSLLQWQVVERLAATARRVVVAGDDDQAIYAWAGAALEHFVRMHGQARVLGQSWRVPRTVQALATEIISRCSLRRPKNWRAREEVGGVVRHGVFDDVDLSGESVLILARNNFVLRDYVAPSLRSQGVIFEWGGKRSVPEDTLSAIVAWERLRRGGEATVADVQRIYPLLSAVSRGHRSLHGWPDDRIVTMSILRDEGGLQTDAVWHEAMDRMPSEMMSYILAARRSGESLSKSPRVRLSTIHGSKGGQADKVVLLLEMARRTAEEAEEKPDDEARVWYVGATRARSELHIVSSASKYAYAL